MKKKKWRDIRSAVTMMCVMLAMLSSATFAWFTLTDSPTVAGLEMQAVSSGGLLVSKESDTGFANAIQILASDADNLNGTANPLLLKPVTPSTTVAGSFYLPKYAGGYVTGLQDTAISSTGLKDHVAVYTYYIKAEEGTVNVGIITGDANQSNDPVLNGGVAMASGTFIREKDAATADASTLNAAAAVRIGLLVEGESEMIIYEPNSNATATGTTAPVAADAGIPAVTADIVSEISGNITGGAKGVVGTTTSDTLFQVGADNAKKVTMYVWLEGTDDQCANEIRADLLEGQIQFTIIE